MLRLDLPCVGVFDVASSAGADSADAVARLLSFVRGAERISFSGRTVLLNVGSNQLCHPDCTDIARGLAAAISQRGAVVLLPEHRSPETKSKDTSDLKGEEPKFPWRRVTLDRRRSRKVHLNSHPYRIPKLIFEVDLVINLACLFEEPRARLAGAIYNMSELLCHSYRRNCPISSLDTVSFNTTIVDFISRVAPDLNIVIVPGGSQGTFQLLVSTDAVAVDSLAAGLAGLDPQQIPAVQLAAESGLGIGWLEAIRLYGDRPRRPAGDRALKSLQSNVQTSNPAGGPGLSGHGLSAETFRGIRPVSVTYCPHLDSARSLAAVSTCVRDARCSGCRECVGSCPMLVS